MPYNAAGLDGGRNALQTADSDIELEFDRSLVFVFPVYLTLQLRKHIASGVCVALLVASVNLLSHWGKIFCRELRTQMSLRRALTAQVGWC